MWLLEEQLFKKLESIHASGFVPTAEQMTHCQAVRAESETNGSTTTVKIHGVLTKEFDFMAMLFGGGNTIYSEVIAQLKALEADKAVTSISLDIDSPGGEIDGLFGLTDFMKAMSTPMTANVTGSASSAAFAIASQADQVITIMLVVFGHCLHTLE